jgi:hypothetical protein
MPKVIENPTPPTLEISKNNVWSFFLVEWKLRELIAEVSAGSEKAHGARESLRESNYINLSKLPA